MSILNNSLLLGQEGGGGYAISRSLRFNSSDSAYLSRTPASAGNRKQFTLSFWMKRSVLSTTQMLFHAGNANSNPTTDNFRFRYASDVFEIIIGGGTSSVAARFANVVYRDCSAWYHIVLAVDTDQAAIGNAFKIYANGSQTVTATSFGSVGYSSGINTAVNDSVVHNIGRDTVPSNYLDGYLADIHFIDGQALDPTSFGEFSATTGVWMPKAYTGTYGTNGFHLDFSNNASAAALGTDTSGNGNTWTVNNISVVSSYSTVVSNIASAGTTWGNINNAFDGNTGTYADGTGNNGTVSTITFNKPLTGVTLLEYYWGGTSTYGYNSTNVGTGPSSSTPGYVTAYSGSAITVNNLRAVSQAGDGVVRVYAIRVNGTVLTGYTEGNPAQNDSLVDVPTNGAQTDTGAGGEVRGNYATLNPLANKGVTLANGNLDLTRPVADSETIVYSTIAVSSGKWYAEMTAGVDSIPGISLASARLTTYSGGASGSYGYYSTGVLFANGSTSSYGASFASGDVIGVALDLDAGTLVFYKNGVSQGTAASSLSGAFVFTGRGSNNSTPEIWNFGQRPFAYTAPSGFKALCTANLPSTTITTSGSYTGNGVADGPFVFLNGVPTAMTVGGNAVTFGTHADKLSNGFKIRTTSTTYNQNASTYNYTITSTGAPFKTARAQPNP